MRNKKIFLIILILLLKNGFSQTEISPFLFGQNAWMPEYIDNIYYNGQLNNLWQEVADCNIKFIRVGGIANDIHLMTDQQVLNIIDSIRNIGAEPLIQISYGNGAFTANQAATMVDFVNNTSSRNVKYWAIGNEPVVGYSVVASDIEIYFKEFATAMKQVDNTIKIVGPDLAWYNQSLLSALLGGTNDITGLDVNGNYYLDVLSYHIYAFDGTQTRTDVINSYTNSIAPSVTDLMNKLANANTLHNRIGTDSLTWAVTEFNINYQNPSANDVTDLGANSFINGQLWAEIFSLGMQYEAVFMCPWSIHESNGDTSTGDLGFIGGTLGNFSFRSSYYHEQLLSNNTFGFFANYYNNIIGVHTFGSHNSTDISVTIVNMNNQSFSYEVIHNSTETSTADLVINTDTLDIQATYNDIIDAECTQVLVFDNLGIIKQKYTYCVADFAPVLTEFPTAATTILNNNNYNCTIYPNPSNNNIIITAISPIESVSIYTLLGEKILKTNLTTINVEDLKKGVYILRIKIQNSLITKQFIKK